MSGVYNRKLFRQSGARDELRKMGGIMSSSEELMREALMTGMQAPGPADLGPMAMPRQQPMGMPAPPVMQPQQPMMQQPMAPMPMDMGMQQPMAPMPMDMGMQQPMAPMPMQQPMMQQPMMQPQQPMMQQPMAEPAFMPPGMPQSAMQQPAGFAGGGFIMLPGMMGEEPVDITKPAGTAVEAPTVELDEDIVATAKDLEMRLEDEPPYAVANKILSKAEEKGTELTGDVQSDLASVYASLTGDPAAYEKNIDELNRGIIGAAIGAGTSARATENISKGLLVGLEAAKDTEERRVKEARALQLAQLQAQAAEAKERGASESRAYRNPVDAYQDAYQAVMNASEIDLEIPEGMSREDYADQVAVDLIRRSYSPEQLVGSPFEGMSAPAADSAGPANVDQEAVLEEARNAIKGGRDPAGVAAKLKQMGIDPELL
jgi:hypothetical protein